MEKYPKDLNEMEAWFATEESCRNYLFEIRWPEGFLCPKCNCKKYWKSDRDLFICVDCGFHVSLTAGTIFHRSRKSLRMWFKAMWHITSQKYGANALGLKRLLNLGSYHTAWEWLHKLRRAMVRPDRECLRGIVEVDEVYVGGKKKGNPGRAAEGKSLVMIAVEDTSETTGKKSIGRIRMGRVHDATSKNLIDFIKENIQKGSTVRTDGWGGYGNLEKEGYKHRVVGSFISVGEDLLPQIHLVSSLLKRWLMGTYQGAVQPSYLDYYLDEYTFRFNRRKSAYRGKLFYRLMQQAVSVKPVYAKNL